MARFRVVIDYGLCQGHSVCAAEVPDLFRLVDKGEAYPQAEVTQEFVADELLKKAQDAEEFCPNGAIKVIRVED
jgi:ferredoxin